MVLALTSGLSSLRCSSCWSWSS
uniref:Uncharacterized protein n=1 Tax=Thermomicrobium roseum TaxID=500 RepID=A0A7C1X6L0_THERO